MPKVLDVNVALLEWFKARGIDPDHVSRHGYTVTPVEDGRFLVRWDEVTRDDAAGEWRRKQRDLVVDEEPPPLWAFPTPSRFPKVQGTCPACRTENLFLTMDGLVTCSNAACPDPTRPAAALGVDIEPMP